MVRFVNKSHQLEPITGTTSDFKMVVVKKIHLIISATSFKTSWNSLMYSLREWRSLKRKIEIWGKIENSDTLLNKISIYLPKRLCIGLWAPINFCQSEHSITSILSHIPNCLKYSLSWKEPSQNLWSEILFYVFWSI